MKHSSMLGIASLLSILFFTFHLADDIVRGMEPGSLRALLRHPLGAGTVEPAMAPGPAVQHSNLTRECSQKSSALWRQRLDYYFSQVFFMWPWSPAGGCLHRLQRSVRASTISLR